MTLYIVLCKKKNICILYFGALCKKKINFFINTQDESYRNQTVDIRERGSGLSDTMVSMATLLGISISACSEKFCTKLTVLLGP